MIYIVVLGIIVAVLLGTALVRSLGVHRTRRISWWPAASCPGRSWSSRCSRRGSARAACLPAARTRIATDSRRCGSRRADGSGWSLIAMIAGRARRFAQFTVPDLLETRYNATARVLATIAIVISYTMITSYQFKAGGDILHLIFPDLDQHHRHVHHRRVRHHVYGAGGYGVGRLSRPDHRPAGDGDRADRAADAARRTSAVGTAVHADAAGRITSRCSDR